MMESMGVMPMPMPMRTMVRKLECSCAGAPKGPSRMMRGACRAHSEVRPVWQQGQHNHRNDAAAQDKGSL